MHKNKNVSQGQGHGDKGKVVVVWGSVGRQGRNQ